MAAKGVTDRAGYTLVVYAIDVSHSMAQLKPDPGDSGVKRTRLDWVKEYVARKCEPMIQSGRKTEVVGVVTFGGRTNNQANQAWVAANPEDEDPPYEAVSSEVAIQTAKPKILEVVMNLEPSQNEGNPVSGLVVALDMIRMHKHTKSWSLEIVLITDGESSFDQSEYEEVMEKVDELGVKLSFIGIDFQSPDQAVEKSKSRNKRLSEKFWRIFIPQLYDRVSQTSDFNFFLPRLSLFDHELIESRRPHPAVVNGTVSQTHLFIGAAGIDEEQAIQISIRYSKATMRARPPSLSKVWRSAVDLQQPIRTNGPAASQLLSTLIERHSQAQPLSQHDPIPDPTELAAMISSDVKRYTLYVVKHGPENEVAQPSPTQASQVDYRREGLNDNDAPLPTAVEAAEAAEDEEVVAKEDIVKAWRFGSTWVPVEADTFEPLHTQKGVEVIGFVPQRNIEKYTLIGEVRYVWPDLTSPKSQIEFSSLVTALAKTGMAAIVRWVLKDYAEPHIGVCIPSQTLSGDEEERRLDFMYWIKLPFADDQRSFYFPSLTRYKTTSGKNITEHPLIPTQEQCDLMDDLVAHMDLDNVASPTVDSSTETDEDEDGAEDSPRDKVNVTWFDPKLAFNPVIHRIKEAIFHASLTRDLTTDPLGPPHPDTVRYFHTPEEVIQSADKPTQRLRESLNIKKVPAKQKRTAKKTLRDDEGFIDIDELFQDPPKSTQPKAEFISPIKYKAEPGSQKSDEKPSFSGDEDFLSPPTTILRSKPKAGRLVSNDRPLEDFTRLVEGEGDVFRKAIQDLGVVVEENVASSFSHAAFPLALECLTAMRSTALMYEEVETYNEIIDHLERTVKALSFKHPDFWDHYTKAGRKVARISAEEAREALEEDYE